MAKKYSKHRKNKSSKEKTSSEFNDKEKFKLYLLGIQQLVTVLNIYAQMLLYEATLLGCELVRTHFVNNELQIKADILVQQAVKIFFITGLISFELAMINYDKANEDIMSDADYSIQPNIDLITANTLNVIAGIYYIKAANGLYDRDNLQSIFGFK